VRISLVPILDFSLIVIQHGGTDVFYEFFLDSTKIEEAGVASAHTSNPQTATFFSR